MAKMIDFDEAAKDLPALCEKVAKTRQKVILIRDGTPFVRISPPDASAIDEIDAVDVAEAFMEEYAGVFKELAK
ncbi:MAG: type II toxin-antitoxin system Phd/YefM family antitoxin [Eggerthellaceae bacterium]|nr:type II toxin-antitoxin system Phd/YefM family antitoxin [Eggerthellaceae bacterium]